MNNQLFSFLKEKLFLIKNRQKAMTEKTSKQSTKRPRLNGTHRWTEVQTIDLLHMIVDEVKERVESFEKPTAQAFYKKIASKSSLLCSIQWVPMKCKMRHLRTSFTSAVAWKNKTGSDLLAVGDEKSVAQYLEKICPHFDLLEQIFGSRKGVNPRVIWETSSPDFIEVDESCVSNFEEYLDFEMNSIENGTLCTGGPEVSAAQFESSSEVFQNDAADASEPTVQSELNYSVSPKNTSKRTSKAKPAPFCQLLDIQEKRLELEVKKFELETEKTRSEIELKKIEINHKYEINKMEMEKQERIEREERKLRIESEERMKKYELDLKFQQTHYI